LGIKKPLKILSPDMEVLLSLLVLVLLAGIQVGGSSLGIKKPLKKILSPDLKVLLVLLVLVLMTRNHLGILLGDQKAPKNPLT
jgi:SNF family Na+-dependent transporter